MDSERVGCVMAARLGCTAVRELFKRGGCSCGAVPMLTKLRRLLGRRTKLRMQERLQKNSRSGAEQ